MSPGGRRRGLLGDRVKLGVGRGGADLQEAVLGELFVGDAQAETSA